MNNIGFGILCFGEDYYFKGAIEKYNHFSGFGPVFILTDKREKFYTHVDMKCVWNYNARVKSYHDKLLLIEPMMQYSDIVILIDADTHIKDYSFLNKFANYDFKEGISYVDVLLNHKSAKEFVREFDMSSSEWSEYKKYAESIYPPFINFELMWEYFLVFNKKGFNRDKFFETYEKLQIAKDFCELKSSKKVIGAGEGVSISIASKLSETPCQRDMVLYDIIKDSMESVSRRFTPEHLWPDWMK